MLVYGSLREIDRIHSFSNGSKVLSDDYFITFAKPCFVKFDICHTNSIGYMESIFAMVCAIPVKIPIMAF